jgi:putative transposase
MCDVLGVSKSGYYVWKKRPKSQQKIRKEKLTPKLNMNTLILEKIMGVPRLLKNLIKKALKSLKKQ